MEGADEKITKAAQALRFAEEEKELDIKGIAESEALIERFRAEANQPVCVGGAPPPESGQVETKGFQFTGDGPPPQWAKELHELRQQVAQLQGKDRTVGVEPSRKRLRACSMDVRPSERFTGGDVRRENPRCFKTCEVGSRWRWPVENVDSRRSPFHSREFNCEHGAMSAALWRPRIQSERSDRPHVSRVLHGLRGVPTQVLGFGAVSENMPKNAPLCLLKKKLVVTQWLRQERQHFRHPRGQT